MVQNRDLGDENFLPHLMCYPSTKFIKRRLFNTPKNKDEFDKLFRKLDICAFADYEYFVMCGFDFFLFLERLLGAKIGWIEPFFGVRAVRYVTPLGSSVFITLSREMHENYPNKLCIEYLVDKDRIMFDGDSYVERYE